MEIILKTNKFPKPIFISLFPPLPTYYYPFLPIHPSLSSLFSFLVSLSLKSHVHPIISSLFSISFSSFFFSPPNLFLFHYLLYILIFLLFSFFFFFPFSLLFTSHQLHLSSFFFFSFLTSFPREHHHRMTVM